MNYIKFKVESNNHYWHERLQKAYSKAGFENLREVGERLLPIIEELVGVPPNPLYFTAKYRDALRTMNIKQEIWPSFALQMI